MLGGGDGDYSPRAIENLLTPLTGSLFLYDDA